MYLLKKIKSLKHKVKTLSLLETQIEIQKHTQKVDSHTTRLETPFDTNLGTKKSFMLNF